MNPKVEEWTDFAWQGVRLRVPEVWNLGKVDGDRSSGYARLDDAEIVRLEVEWRQVPGKGRGVGIAQLVDRYLSKLEKKAQKADVGFTVKRRAKFLKDKSWLEGSDYETFVWEADYKAYNLARACGECGRIVLLRVLARKNENGMEELAGDIFRTLDDHSHDGILLWSVYGLNFEMSDEYKLEKHDLKSGNIQLTFEKKNHVCRIQRLSMAQMLLKGTTLDEWYPNFFKKQLKDFDFDITEGVSVARGHEGLRVAGRPKSRWRQVLRPLPLVNTRPRQYLDGLVWHCPEENKICIAEHLHRKKDEVEGGLTNLLNERYACHEEAKTESGGDAGLEAGAQRPGQLGKER